MLTLVRQARRRLLYNELLSQGANAGSAALLAFILLLLAGTQVLSWRWTLLLPLAAAAFGLYRARKHLPSPYGVAQIVDHRAHLADTLSTALYFSQPEAGTHGSPNVRRVQSQRADRLAESVDVRQAVPYTMPRTVYLMAALFLVASSLFALRYGLSRRLDLKQPLASMLQETFGADAPAQQAKNQQRRMRQPEPETQPDDTGSAVEEPDQKQGDQQDADSANAEEPGDSQKPVGEQKASQADSKKQSDEGDKADGDQKDGQGDDRSGDEGDDSQTTKSNDGKSDQKQDSSAKQDSNNAGENSSLMSKVKDFAQNLLSRVKPQQGQSGAQQQSSQDPKNSQSKGQQNGKQQSSKEGQQQNGQQGDAQEGQAGEQAQSAQDPQGKGTGKSDAQQPSKQPGSGIGSQDGDKNIKQAQDLAAMGKISEIFGKRSATISGESTVEVQQTSQQLHTPYAQRGTQHAQGGAEIRRDEVPVALQSYVEQYFEQVRKQAPQSSQEPPAKK